MNEQEIRHITGHRELTQHEIDLMNEVSAKASELRTFIDNLRTDLSQDRPDPRWMSIAHTHFQEGLMALRRAIAKPTTF